MTMVAGVGTDERSFRKRFRSAARITAQEVTRPSTCLYLRLSLIHSLSTSAFPLEIQNITLVNKPAVSIELSAQTPGTPERDLELRQDSRRGQWRLREEKDNTRKSHGTTRLGNLHNITMIMIENGMRKLL